MLITRAPLNLLPNPVRCDVAIYVWVDDYLGPITFLDLLTKGCGNNRTSWSNKENDLLMAESHAERDPAARSAAFDRIEEILAAEAPVLPVDFYTSGHLIHKTVRRRHPTHLEIHPWRRLWLEQIGRAAT